jgi:hypothetical protein
VLRRDRLQRLLRLALACAVLGVGSIAAGPAAATDATDAGVGAWVGRYCTPQGCRGSLESAVGNAAGFGAAALAAAFVARRRSA